MPMLGCSDPSGKPECSSLFAGHRERCIAKPRSRARLFVRLNAVLRPGLNTRRVLRAVSASAICQHVRCKAQRCNRRRIELAVRLQAASLLEALYCRLGALAPHAVDGAVIEAKRAQP